MIEQSHLEALAVPLGASRLQALAACQVLSSPAFLRMDLVCECLCMPEPLLSTSD